MCFFGSLLFVSNLTLSAFCPVPFLFARLIQSGLRPGRLVTVLHVGRQKDVVSRGGGPPRDGNRGEAGKAEVQNGCVLWLQRGKVQKHEIYSDIVEMRHVEDEDLKKHTTQHCQKEIYKKTHKDSSGVYCGTTLVLRVPAPVGYMC